MQKIYLLLVLTALFWGSSWIVVKQLTSELNPIAIAAMRFLIVSLLFLPVAVWLHLHGERLKKNDFGKLVLLGVFGVALLYIFQYEGVNLTTATNASLMVAFNPSMTLLLSSFLLKEKIGFRKIAAIAVAFLGASLVITNGELNIGVRMNDILGSLLSLASTFCWAVYTVINKKFLETHSALFSTVYTSIFGAFILLPALLLSQSEIAQLSLYAWLGLIYLAVTCTVFGYLIWSYSLTAVDASQAAVFIYLVPLFSVILACIFLGENLTFYSAFGGFLILAGVYCSTL
jgi:drug/metabolite transporter (DMT)-like permease